MMCPVQLVVSDRHSREEVNAAISDKLKDIVVVWGVRYAVLSMFEENGWERRNIFVQKTVLRLVQIVLYAIEGWCPGSGS